MQFVRPEPGYGKKRGESIAITRVSNIAVPTNGRLNELSALALDLIQSELEPVLVRAQPRVLDPEHNVLRSEHRHVVRGFSRRTFPLLE